MIATWSSRWLSMMWARFTRPYKRSSEMTPAVRISNSSRARVRVVAGRIDST
jgi:hypothetical protein